MQLIYSRLMEKYKTSRTSQEKGSRKIFLLSFIDKLHWLGKSTGTSLIWPRSHSYVAEIKTEPESSRLPFLLLQNALHEDFTDILCSFFAHRRHWTCPREFSERGNSCGFFSLVSITWSCIDFTLPWTFSRDCFLAFTSLNHFILLTCFRNKRPDSRQIYISTSFLYTWQINFPLIII